MKNTVTELKTDIYCACVFSIIAFVVSFGMTRIPIVGTLLSFPAAAVIGFFIGWFAAPVWGRILLVVCAFVGFTLALFMRGTQSILMLTVSLTICLLLSAVIGTVRGNAHERKKIFHTIKH